MPDHDLHRNIYINVILTLYHKHQIEAKHCRLHDIPATSTLFLLRVPPNVSSLLLFLSLPLSGLNLPHGSIVTDNYSGKCIVCTQLGVLRTSIVCYATTLIM